MSCERQPPGQFQWHLAWPIFALLWIILSSYRDVAARLWLLDEMVYAPLLAVAAIGLFVIRARKLSWLPLCRRSHGWAARYYSAARWPTFLADLKVSS